MPQLVFARDPRVWTRVSREPFMRRGQQSEFDEGVVMPMRPITLGDEIFIFYYAKNRGEHWGEPTTDGKSITTSSLGLAKRIALGVKRSGKIGNHRCRFFANPVDINVVGAVGAGADKFQVDNSGWTES